MNKLTFRSSVSHTILYMIDVLSVVNVEFYYRNKYYLIAEGFFSSEYTGSNIHRYFI